MGGMATVGVLNHNKTVRENLKHMLHNYQHPEADREEVVFGGGFYVVFIAIIYMFSCSVLFLIMWFKNVFTRQFKQSFKDHVSVLVVAGSCVSALICFTWGRELMNSDDEVDQIKGYLICITCAIPALLGLIVLLIGCILWCVAGTGVETLQYRRT